MSASTAVTFRQAAARLGLKALPASKRELKTHFLALAKQRHPDSARPSSDGGAAAAAGSSSSRAGGKQVDMAELSESYRALAQLYDAETGQLARDPTGAPQNAFDPNRAGSFVGEVPRPDPEKVGRMWLPWQRERPASAQRLEDADAPRWALACDRAISTARAQLKAATSRAVASVRYILTADDTVPRDPKR